MDSDYISIDIKEDRIDNIENKLNQLYIKDKINTVSIIIILMILIKVYILLYDNLYIYRY